MQVKAKTNSANLAAVAALLALGGAGPAAASCGSAFCSLHGEWDTQGVWLEPGARFDLRYEYINQDQPRAGRDKKAVGEIRKHHDEVRTLNRNVFANLDYTFSSLWGVTAQLPFVQRDHSHIHNHQGAQLHETWDISALGDARVFGRRRLSAGEESAGAWGVIFGAKLPTGDTEEKNSAGQLAERSLQPGTGTTDLILGGFYHTQLLLFDRSVTGFAQLQAQWPTSEHKGYEPGSQFSIDAGVSHALSPSWTAMLQANVQIKARDKGTEAEPADSGGSFAWLSPGVSYGLGKHTRVHGFVQLPLYQRVNGVQLTADWAAATGVSMSF